MKVKNCTPHVLNIIDGRGEVRDIPKSGILPRVDEKKVVIETITTEGLNFEITASEFGEVVGLPEKEDGLLLIVSRLVAQACADRDDLLVPGELIRDENGNVIGARGFSRVSTKASR